jgi:propionyl-CoA carboxylase alpha chain
MISSVLVANRGEIARRVFRTCRAMGLETVAVFSDPDRHAPFVAEADQAFALGGSAGTDSYLRPDLILDAARRSGATAIHPGYGFLAENAEFARSVIDAGLTWIGPSPDAMARMGSKLESKRLVGEAGVPTLASVDLSERPPPRSVTRYSSRRLPAAAARACGSFQSRAACSTLSVARSARP